MPGDGVATTTGGGRVAPVRPQTVDELLAYASDELPRVIELASSFAIPRLEVASNKTLIGVAPGAGIDGGIFVKGTKTAPVVNVILRNLRVNGATSDVNGDAISVQYAHHVWIDHVDVYDGPDGSLDLTHGANWITVSWSKIRYTPSYRAAQGEKAEQHRFATLIGHSDKNEAEDEGRLKISMHHNWWGERVIERMPRVRFGQVHVFNNYFASAGNNYCVRAGRGAKLLIEANAFEGVKDPHVFNSVADQATAHITARDNSYLFATGERAIGGGGVPFVVAPYPLRLDPAASVPALVRGCAGQR